MKCFCWDIETAIIKVVTELIYEEVLLRSEGHWVGDCVEQTPSIEGHGPGLLKLR